MSVASEAVEVGAKSGFWAKVAEKGNNATTKGREMGGRLATHIGEHKTPYALLGAGTVATVAYNAGGNHRENLMNRVQSQGQGAQR